MDQRARRAVLAVCLVGALTAMAVHYGAVAEARDPYPGASALADDYRAHVGESFFMWMEVTAVEDGAVTARSDGSGTVVLTVSPAPERVAVGDVVQVYGTLEPGHRVAAQRVVVSERGDRLSMYGLSVLAALLAAGYLFREWTVDWRTLTLVPRRDEDA